MTPAIASLVPEIAPAPAASDAAGTAGDAARFGAALEQAMLAAQAGQPKGTDPAAPPMLMLLLAEVPSEADAETDGSDAKPVEAPVPQGMRDAAAAHVGTMPSVVGESSAGPADAMSPRTGLAGSAAMPSGVPSEATNGLPIEPALAEGTAAPSHAMREATAESTGCMLAAEEATDGALRRGAASSTPRLETQAAEPVARAESSDRTAEPTDAPSADADDAGMQVRSRRRSSRTTSPVIADGAEPPVAPAQLPPQAMAQAVSSPAPSSTPTGDGDADTAEASDASRQPSRIERQHGEADRAQQMAGRLHSRQSATTSHGVPAAREADEARMAVAIAQAAGLDPAAPEASSGALPAGVRVLDLHVQAARRQHLVANGKRTTGAPRTGEEAAAALDIAAAPQAPGAEALDRLRWPTVTSLPQESGARATTPESLVPPLQAAPPAETSAPSDAASTTSPALDMAASLSANAATRGDKPSHDSPRDGKAKDDAPVALFAPAVPSATTSTRGESPAVPAAPATTAAARTEPAPRTGGIERISVRLGDGDGAPTVRIAIWQGNVDAKVITNDAQLARDLGRGAHELASALEARGFDAAQVRVRGTPSANEMMGPAQLAGSAMTEARQPEQSSQQDGRRSHEERAQAWRDERPEQRQQGRQPRRPRRDDDETEA